MFYLTIFLVSAACVVFITPLVILFAKKLHLIDEPGVRIHPATTHTGSIPRAGGLAIFLGIVLPIIFFIPLSVQTIGILAALCILTIIGILDDYRDINPYIRLATNTVAVLCIIGVGIGIPYVTNPFGGIIPLDTIRVSFSFYGDHSFLIWADIFAFFWIMWTMHIVGWSAGVDGQMPGFVAIAAAVLGLLALRFPALNASQELAASLAFILSGAFAGFIPWNFYPQKIMPGYSGKMIAGILLAVLGILSYGKVGTALLVLGIPTIDAVYTLLRRIGQKKSPVWADRGHLHHKLLELGWGKRKIALFYWGVSAILGAVALTVTSKQKLFVFLLVGVLFIGFLLWLHFFTPSSKQQGHDNG